MRASFFILFAFCLSCSEVELSELEVDDSFQTSKTSNLNLRSKKFMTRASLEFKETYLSSKLDMVFVLDTHTKAKPLYGKDFLGYDFLNYFYNYSWKIAWTDMSMDIQTLEKETNEKKSRCGFLGNLFLTTTGALRGSDKIASMGMEGLSYCFSNLKKQSKKKNNAYANGDFLPFEGIHKQFVLSKTTQHSSGILSQSLILPNPKDKAYKAPILKDNPSFPLLSFFSNLSKNLYPQQGTRSFFREDSLVVVVLFSLTDSKLSLDAERLKKSFKQAFEPHGRFKLILVTLTEDSQVFCPLMNNLDSDSTPKNLIQLVKKSGGSVLDICSKQLGAELSHEILKGLDTQKILETNSVAEFNDTKYETQKTSKISPVSNFQNPLPKELRSQ